MNKIKQFFKYLYEDLYNRGSVKRLNIAYSITLFLGCFLWYEALLPENATGGLAYAYYIFSLFIIDVILFIFFLISFFIENKNKDKRIKDNPIINSKFYRIISILSVFRVLISLSVCVLYFSALLIPAFNDLIEDYFSK